MLTNKEIEELEAKYLNKYFHFLKFAEDELLEWFKTKEKIKDDWIWLYKSWISDFAVWAERIVYSLLNWKWIWQPNSCPVGADLFFEVNDAYIHIDLKTVWATLNPKKWNKSRWIDAWSNNIWDYINNIFVWTNQNSYKWKMEVTRGVDKWTLRDYTPTLPTFYNKWKANEKVCLSYFITILYDKDTLDILVMNIACMPNWQLESHYKNRVLQAWKNLDKTRFKFTKVPNFELLDDSPSRLKVIFYDKNMDDTYKNKLDFFKNIYN